MSTASVVPVEEGRFHRDRGGRRWWPVSGKDQLGQDGEELAARFLVQQGFTVVERNWRCDLGEIDIIARDGAALVVCEVKTRSGLGYGSPLEAVTRRKVARLRQLAARWLASHDARAREIRIDVIGIVAAPGGQPSIEHVRMAA